MQSLFPQFVGGGTASARTPLVSFNAGKMTAEPRDGGKFLVSPDKRKGTISLVRGDDQLIHFQWKDRQTGNVPDDFIIFPNDASFHKVDTKREGDRVYVLQYKGSSRRFFFWMQNKDSSKDAENSKTLNDYMNNPPQPSERGGNSGNSTGQLDQNTLMQMLGAIGNSGGAGGVQMADLQNILQNMGLPANNAAMTSVSAASSSPSSSSATASSSDVPNPPSSLLRTQSGHHAPGSQPSKPPSGITADALRRAMSQAQEGGSSSQRSISLASLLNADKVIPHILSTEVTSTLLPLLPEGLQTTAELHSTLRSPQLRQSIGSLSHALETSNFNAIMDSFGLDASKGVEYLNRGDGIGAFLAAIQAWGDAQRDNPRK